MVDHLNQATSVLRRGHVAVLFTGRRRRRQHTAHQSDVDCILRVVLATLTDLKLHLVTTSTNTTTIRTKYTTSLIDYIWSIKWKV